MKFAYHFYYYNYGMNYRPFTVVTKSEVKLWDSCYITEMRSNSFSLAHRTLQTSLALRILALKKFRGCVKGVVYRTHRNLKCQVSKLQRSRSVKVRNFRRP